MQKLLWWGYKHTSGTYQAKRYFDDRDLEEGRQSDFCEEVVGPFQATDRSEALAKVKELTDPDIQLENGDDDSLGSDYLLDDQPEDLYGW